MPRYIRNGVLAGILVITREQSGCEISPVGEEEVKVAESEAPGITGAWCKREMLRC